MAVVLDPQNYLKIIKINFFSESNFGINIKPLDLGYLSPKYSGTNVKSILLMSITDSRLKTDFVLHAITKWVKILIMEKFLVVD